MTETQFTEVTGKPFVKEDVTLEPDPVETKLPANIVPLQSRRLFVIRQLRNVLSVPFVKRRLLHADDGIHIYGRNLVYVHQRRYQFFEICGHHKRKKTPHQIGTDPIR